MGTVDCCFALKGRRERDRRHGKVTAWSLQEKRRKARLGVGSAPSVE